MSTLQVDTINESTSASGVTIDGALIKDGKVTGGATGLTLLHSSTFSTVSSKSIDSVFSSTYKNYKINLSILSSNTTDYMFRLRDGSGDLYTADHMSIGYYKPSPQAYLNGHIQRLTYYPFKLTNNQLKTVTS